MLSLEESEALRLAAAQAFSPRTPVSTRELFAGRWSQLTRISDTVSQTGLHAVIFGERGVGKTSLSFIIGPLLEVLNEEKDREGETRIVIRVNAYSTDTFSSLWIKAFDEIYWHKERPTIGLRPSVEHERVTLREACGLGDEISIDDVRRTVTHLKGSVFIFDEFDRLHKRHASGFTDLIKAMSDAAAASTIVIVGVSETVDGLMKDHASIGRALVQIAMPRMTENELSEILTNAEKALGVLFDSSARKLIVRMSQGLPHYTHLIGLHSVRAAADRFVRTVSDQDVRTAFNTAVSETDQTASDTYARAIHSAQPGAKYAQVLLAASVAAYTHGDSSGYFQLSNLVGPMSEIMRRPEEIAGFNKHVSEFLEEKRGSVLERTGRPRAYRYRFSHPLLPPYVIMRSIRDSLVSASHAEALLGNGESIA